MEESWNWVPVNEVGVWEGLLRGLRQAVRCACLCHPYCAETSARLLAT